VEDSMGRKWEDARLHARSLSLHMFCLNNELTSEDKFAF
jgi:hypothetical protein